MDTGLIIIIIIAFLFFIGSFSILFSIFFEKEEIINNSIFNDNYPKNKSTYKNYEDEDDLSNYEDYESYEDELFIKDEDT